MENLINAVRKALNCNNWFAALFLSLTFPDICGALENPSRGVPGEVGDRYRAWYTRYLLPNYPRFSAQDCWLLRNACLHQGSDQDARMAFERVHFIEPTGGSNVIHNNELNNALQLQVDIFCNDFCRGVEQWTQDINNNTDVVNRLNALMNIHPISSLRPFISLG